MKTPTEWLQTDEYQDLYILDPDGWRDEDAPSWDTPITQYEFESRLSRCTVGRK